MIKSPNPKHYDLGCRTFRFDSNVRNFMSDSLKTVSNQDDIHQSLRSSCSVVANYIEANGSIRRANKSLEHSNSGFNICFVVRDSDINIIELQ